MSKPEKSVKFSHGVNTIFVVRHYDLDDIVGKVLTIVESAGLPQKQEEAIKGLIRQAVWTTIDNGSRIYLSEEGLMKAMGK